MDSPNPYRTTYIAEDAAREFRDIDISLKRHPISKDVMTKDGNDAIKQAVVNLVMLNLYEKPFHPTIGGDIYPLMFENFNMPGTTDLLEMKIKKTLKENEPRIEVQGVKIEERPDQNAIAASIFYKIINTLEPIQVDMFLDIKR